MRQKIKSEIFTRERREILGEKWIFLINSSVYLSFTIFDIESSNLSMIFYSKNILSFFDARTGSGMAL